MAREVWLPVHIFCRDRKSVPPDDLVPPGTFMPCTFKLDGHVTLRGRVHPATETALNTHHLDTATLGDFYGHSNLEVKMGDDTVGALDVHRDGVRFAWTGQLPESRTPII